jgi:tripartite-type tricarboxylate transporter receptor subunit TctC
VTRLLLAAVLLTFGLAQAQPYPSKPVRIIVPFPPGGPTDLYARLIAQHLQEAFAQPVVVENRPGATGLTGSAVVQQAPADGYTLLFTSNSAHVISPMLRTPHPFEPTRDFTPVAMLLRYPMYLLVNPAVPVTTLQEFVAYARARPGKLNYSSVGIGSGGHLACELFNINARTEIVHVP